MPCDIRYEVGTTFMQDPQRNVYKRRSLFFNKLFIWRF